MSGRPNPKWMETMIAKHGSRKAVAVVMAQHGARGGRNSTGGGFASYRPGKDGLTGPERASAVGAIGGRISRRGPSKRKSA